MWVLVLIFICCGTPTSAVVHEYPTLEACFAAGNVWISPAANPSKTVARYTCNQLASGSAGDGNGTVPAVGTMPAVETETAMATRTWVSGVGDDANPCSRTAPCKTFAGAISKTAPAGEINVLDPGGFGGVTITKSITIDGGGGGILASTQGAGTFGINVAAGPTDVVIFRNLRINGANQTGSPGTNGIIFASGAALTVENCDVIEFGQNGINITSGANSRTSVINTILASNTLAGIQVRPTAGTANVSLFNVRSLGNGVGGWGDATGGGTVKMTISKSHVGGSVGDGILSIAGATNAGIIVESTLVIGNGANEIVANKTAAGSAAVFVGTSQISEYAGGVASVGGGLTGTYRNNILRGSNANDGAFNTVLNPQ